MWTRGEDDGSVYEYRTKDEEPLWTMGWNSEIWRCWQFSNWNPSQTAAVKKAAHDFWSFSPTPWFWVWDFITTSTNRSPRFIGIYHTMSCSFKGAVQFSTWRTTWLSFQRNKLYLYLAWKWDGVCNRRKIDYMFYSLPPHLHPFHFQTLTDHMPKIHFNSQSMPARKIWRFSNGGKMRRSTSCLIYCVFSMTVYLFGVVYRLIYGSLCMNFSLVPLRVFPPLLNPGTLVFTEINICIFYIWIFGTQNDINSSSTQTRYV